ncbi:MAG: DeoR family transcriptional regulator [Bacteroidales bacterium]|nr:DeoR family transcriptional regulator [Bacteroidales bacterium]
MLGTSYEKSSNDSSDNVTDKRGIQILQSIKENNQISTTELSEKLKVTKRTILRDIEKLKAQKKIKRVGGEKGGHWEILKYKV